MKALPRIALCIGLLSAAGVAADTYRVGVELQPYQPYYSLESGEYRGYARDLLDAFAADQGHRFIYVALPVKRLQSDFLSGKLDFKYPDHPHWNRERKQGRTVHYSAATAPYQDGVLVLPAYLGQGKARIKLLGTQLGFTPWPFLADIESGQIALTQTNRIDSLLKMALAGRVDAVYLNPLVARHALVAAGLPGDALVLDRGLPQVEDHYYLSSLRHPEVIAAFDAFLRAHPALLRRIGDKYAIDWSRYRAP